MANFHGGNRAARIGFHNRPARRAKSVLANPRTPLHSFELLEDRNLLAATATSTVNTDSVVHADSTGVLGVNVGYWDSDLLTSQTSQMISAAGLTQFRFPGGIVADDYHFNASTEQGDSSAVTIPQFAQLVSNLKGTGMVTVDYGSGSPQEAAAELAYLQGSPSDSTVIGTGQEWNDGTNTWQNVNWQTVGYWASLRAAAPLSKDDGLNFMRISHSAPFTSIDDWEIGNEQYGNWAIDHHESPGTNPTNYATFASQFATMATEITKTAGVAPILIGVDSANPTGVGDSNWTVNVLTSGAKLGFVPGFISDHNYMYGPGQENDATLLNSTATNPNSLLDWSTRYADYESDLVKTVGSSAATNVQIMGTEWNSVYTNTGKQASSLVNGLFVAESIGSMLESGYSGGMIWALRDEYDTQYNNSSSLYGWRQGGDYGLLGSPALNNPPATGPYVAYPNYFAMQLASKFVQAGGEVVQATSSNSNLQVYAIQESDGDLELMVINNSSSSAITDQFNVSGFQVGTTANVWQYGETQDTAQSQTTNGASALANFSSTLAVNGGSFSYAFPQYSMTVLDVAPATSAASPAVTASGNKTNFTAGGPAVALDGGLQVGPAGSNLTGATVKINNFQSGDTLNFTPQNNISIVSNSGGQLTLSGNASAANYQVALRSITFSNNTNTSLTARSVSIVVANGSQGSSPAAESVSVFAPAEVTGLYVKGAGWTSAFDSSLGNAGLGNAATPALGYALQTGGDQSATLPWSNLDTIEATFSQAVNISRSSLVLSGGNGGSTPAVTGFSSLGNNTYSWTLSEPLDDNRYEVSFLATGGGAVTDARGAGLDGEWNTGTTTFAAGSGNHLSGGDFNFLFNVLPGDADQSGLVNAADYNQVRQDLGAVAGSGGDVFYEDVDGSGLINADDYNSVRSLLGLVLPNPVPAPQVNQVVGLVTTDLTAVALAVQEGTSSLTVTTNSNLSNIASPLQSSLGIGSNATIDNGDESIASSLTASDLLPTQFASGQNQATDSALSDFDLADIWL
jgi:alpha-L-arabinofuranosidase